MPVPASDPPPARTPKATPAPVPGAEKATPAPAPGAEKATPAPYPGAEKAAPPRGRRTAAIAVASVIGTAIAGAAATALITSERVDQFFGVLGGAAAGQVASETKPLEYKTVTDDDRAVLLEIPADWVVVHTSYDAAFGGVREPGASLLAGDGVGDGSDWGESAVYVGASTATASRYELPESTPAERTAVLSALAEEYDWSIDQCLHATDELALPTGFAGVSTSWDDCAQTDGMRVWEIYASSDDGAVFLFMQVFLPPEADASIARHLVETLTVTRSEIPGATGGASVRP